MTLQTWEHTKPYTRPVQPITLSGDRYALPSDFVEGLAFLMPFPVKGRESFEKWVHLINGKLYVITNNMILDYSIGQNELPNLAFKAPAIIRILNSFDTPPTQLMIDDDTFLFSWDDGQVCCIVSFQPHPISIGGKNAPAHASTLDRHWNFQAGIALDEESRKTLRRMHGGSKLLSDLFLNPTATVSRGDGINRKRHDVAEVENLSPFPNNASRPMRFDRRAFLDMIKIATEIDFKSSPVCFRHEQGRGMLIERTLGLDVPDFDLADD
ncbi:MAG: hypothetical protein KUG70_14695 [Rhodobacteraceae bacterium]|nr:hypothetical protein [Paracoccaceae bacterium]